MSLAAPNASSIQCYVQGYLAHNKLLPHMTLQQADAWAPMVVLRGSTFLMSEVPLSVVDHFPIGGGPLRPKKGCC